MANSKFKVGSKVKYRIGFLRSTGQITGDAPRAKGEITGFTPLGDATLAHIKWAGGVELPEKVNCANLTFIGDPETSSY